MVPAFDARRSRWAHGASSGRTSGRLTRLFERLGNFQSQCLRLAHRFKDFVLQFVISCPQFGIDLLLYADWLAPCPFLKPLKPCDPNFEIGHTFRLRRESRIAHHPHFPIGFTFGLIAFSAGGHEISDARDVSCRLPIVHERSEMVPLGGSRAAVGAFQIRWGCFENRQHLPDFLRRWGDDAHYRGDKHIPDA